MIYPSVAYHSMPSATACCQQAKAEGRKKAAGRPQGEVGKGCPATWCRWREEDRDHLAARPQSNAHNDATAAIRCPGYELATAPCNEFPRELVMQLAAPP